jgi:hypothetical protein
MEKPEQPCELCHGAGVVEEMVVDEHWSWHRRLVPCKCQVGEIPIWVKLLVGVVVVYLLSFLVP